MTSVVKVAVKVLTLLVFLAVVAAAFFFERRHIWMGVMSTLSLALVFGYLSYRDIRALTSKRS
jgi:hypothetical protein